MRDADVAKDAALTELSQIIEEGYLMPMDQLTIKKLRADKELILPSKLFLKVKYPLAEYVRQVQCSLSRRWTSPESR